VCHQKKKNGTYRRLQCAPVGVAVQHQGAREEKKREEKEQLGRRFVPIFFEVAAWGRTKTWDEQVRRSRNAQP